MIKVGFCVAYDWQLLKVSIPLIYDCADTICLSIDKNRKTWGGEIYSFDEKSFRTFITSIDSKKKIDVYEDDFSVAGLSAMENDTRQRQCMAERMGKGGWHIQIDSDENFLNFSGFVEKLKKINSNPTAIEKPINVCAFVVPLIKKLPDGYLFVNFEDQFPETLPFATTKPAYVRARNSGHFNVYLSEYVIHETWARSEDDLWLKINNWGHSSEELDYAQKRISYYTLWKSLDKYNYPYVRNFHPAIPATWPALQFLEVNNTVDFLSAFSKPKLSPTNFQLMMKNNRQLARMKHFSSKAMRFIFN